MNIFMSSCTLMFHHFVKVMTYFDFSIQNRSEQKKIYQYRFLQVKLPLEHLQNLKKTPRLHREARNEQGSNPINQWTRSIRIRRAPACMVFPSIKTPSRMFRGNSLWGFEAYYTSRLPAVNSWRSVQRILTFDEKSRASAPNNCSRKHLYV